MMHEGIVIHCSDSPQGRGDNAETIDRWHKERGWSSIGYHFVILEDGTIEAGRDIDKQGAHAKGYNHYIGICLIGIDKFTDKQFESLKALVSGLMENYDIMPNKVLGHYQVDKHGKTCPNIDIVEFKNKIKDKN
jgi:N-acetylmuramoyl-L-alanine amidase